MNYDTWCPISKHKTKKDMSQQPRETKTQNTANNITPHDQQAQEEQEQY